MAQPFTRRRMALLTGASLLLMAATAGLAYGYGLQSALAAQGPLPRGPLLAAAFGFLAILLLDLLVSWGLWRFHRDGAARLSGINALLRLVYSGFLALGVVHLFHALKQPDAHQQLEAFVRLWETGLGVFGLHLLCWGMLVWRQREAKRIFAVLLMLAGACYALNKGLALLSAEYQSVQPWVEQVTALPSAAGELAMAIWLLVRGGRQRSVSPSAQAAS